MASKMKEIEKKAWKSGISEEMQREKKKKEAIPFSKEMGRPLYEFNFGSFLMRERNLLLTSTTEGLNLLHTDEALGLVLTLLAVLARGLGLLVETDALEAVARLIGLERLGVVVDQAKTGGLLSSERSLESVDHNELLVRYFVHLGHLGGQLCLGDGGAARVDDIDDELLAGKQLVVNELASADRAGLFVRHLFHSPQYINSNTLQLASPPLHLANLPSFSTSSFLPLFLPSSRTL